MSGSEKMTSPRDNLQFVVSNNWRAFQQACRGPTANALGGQLFVQVDDHNARVDLFRHGCQQAKVIGLQFETLQNNNPLRSSVR